MIKAIMYTGSAMVSAIALDKGVHHLWLEFWYDVLIALVGFYLGQKLEWMGHDGKESDHE